MRGALTLNQSETDRSKPTSLQSVLTFFRPVLFQVCVPIINVAYFTIFPTNVWAHAMDVLLPRRPRQRKNVEFRDFSRLMLSNKGFVHQMICSKYAIFCHGPKPTGIEYINCLD